MRASDIDISILAQIELSILDLTDDKFKSRIAIQTKGKSRLEQHRIIVTQYLIELKNTTP